jgi:hypothetical protein
MCAAHLLHTNLAAAPSGGKETPESCIGYTFNGKICL